MSETNTLTESIRLFAREKGFDDEVAFNIAEQSLKAACKKQFGTDCNIIFKHEDDDTQIFAKKTIVERVTRRACEITLEEALKVSEMSELEIGDEVSVKIDPKNLGFAAVNAGKQRAIQSIKEIQKNTLYAEYSSKVGEVIIGYYHREKNGNIYVDLGKVEGLLPKKFQSPRDHFGLDKSAGEESRIKALVKEIKKHKQSNIIQLILSRTDSDFVRKILESEIPEIYDGTVTIHNVVRSPGYRTKVSVSTAREEIDPVGACIGTKGSRIQMIIAELEGEKIDVVEYSDDPLIYIKNALSPAEVIEIILMDIEKRSAVAVVSQSQLALAVGRQGLNVRLANRLVDWNIDVKTEEEFKTMDIYTGVRKAAEDLFSLEDEYTEVKEVDKIIEHSDEDAEEIPAISEISELPGISDEIVAVLYENGIEDIHYLIEMKRSDIKALKGMPEDMAEELIALIENVEVVEMSGNEYEEYVEYEDYGDKQVDVEEHEDEEFECPECGKPVTIDMTECPHCGIGLSFEYEDEE